MWSTIADEAVRESPLWMEALRPPGERELVPVFSSLGQARHGLGLETIYEGYLLHYGRPRLFAPGDRDTALLLGDYLYAHGLVRIAELESVQAVADLAELISLCAQLRAEGRPGDGAAWAAAAALLGEGVIAGTQDPEELGLRARAAVGSERVDSALAAHARLVG